MSKRRVTVTVDEVLLEAAAEAVAEGKAVSVSAWVNDAMTAHSERERKRAGLRKLLDEYQAEFGTFTDEELEESERLAKESAASNRTRYDASKHRKKAG